MDPLQTPDALLADLQERKHLAERLRQGGHEPNEANTRRLSIDPVL